MLVNSDHVHDHHVKVWCTRESTHTNVRRRTQDYRRNRPGRAKTFVAREVSLGMGTLQPAAPAASHYCCCSQTQARPGAKPTQACVPLKSTELCRCHFFFSQRLTRLNLRKHSFLSSRHVQKRAVRGKGVCWHASRFLLALL